MEGYAVTEQGRRAIQMLESQGELQDSIILRHLDIARVATAEQLSHITHTEEYIIKEKLKSFLGKRWVWVNRTKLTRF